MIFKLSTIYRRNETIDKADFFLRNILKEVKVSGEIHIVLDCHYDKVGLLLKMFNIIY